MNCGEGDTIIWRGLNRNHTGVVVYDLRDGHYLCDTGTALVLVENNSIIKIATNGKGNG